MNIFVTGATGYIGSAVARQLLASGHRVTGLARSEESARRMSECGVHPVMGDLMVRDSILSAARDADAAVHAGSPGNESNCEADEITVGAILDVFAETGKCFVYTSGIWILGPTGAEVADEDWPIHPFPTVAWRTEVERRVLHAAEHGVRTVVIRPGVAYGQGKGIPAMLRPRADGAVPFVGNGSNHWPLVDVDDLARLYELAIEKAAPASLFLAVSENLLVSDVAEAMREGQRALRVESIPLETARVRLGQFADALVLDQQASSERAMRLLGWVPKAPSLIEDLQAGSYVA
jgi:nucleoside-diphosphate-sugar epimerase